MAEYHYVRKSVRWEGKRYEVRGQTEAETLEKMVDLSLVSSLQMAQRGVSVMFLHISQ